MKNNTIGLFRLILIFFLVFIIQTGYSQGQVDLQEKAKNNIYVQGFGNTETLLSLNYERVVVSTDNELIDLSFRTGFGFQKTYYDRSNKYSFVEELNALIGKGQHRVDVGFGFVLHLSTSDLMSSNIPESENGNHFYVYTLRTGYRWDSPDGVVFLRGSGLITYRPERPKSSKLISRGGAGFSMGVYF